MALSPPPPLSPVITTYNPAQLETPQLYALLTSTIGPRPIALVSSINNAQQPNLAPCSYFNIFSATPPILVFSPNLSGRTAAPKDTLLNVRQVPQVVINMVSFDMVEQVSLSSCMYPAEVNEFVKTGLTPVPSEVVQPARVAESPVQFECLVNDIIELGNKGGAGNLIICEVVRIHLANYILFPDGKVNQHALQLVARLGSNFYSKAYGNALFEVTRPVGQGIGFDALPASLLHSNILTANNLAQLAVVEANLLPTPPDVDIYSQTPQGQATIAQAKQSTTALHQALKTLLDAGKNREAWLLYYSVTNFITSN